MTFYIHNFKSELTCMGTVTKFATLCELIKSESRHRIVESALICYFWANSIIIGISVELKRYLTPSHDVINHDFFDRVPT